MQIWIEGHECGYELECLTKLFFQAEKLPVITVSGMPEAFSGEDKDSLYAGAIGMTHQELVEHEKELYQDVTFLPDTRQAQGHQCDICSNREFCAAHYRLVVRLCYRGTQSMQTRYIVTKPGMFEKSMEYHFGQMVYDLMREATGLTPPWGILTGVRPVKLVRRCLDMGMNEQQAADYLEKRYVSPHKIQLALDTARKERRMLQKVEPMSYSLYVSIPFCPSRCSYCSFVSHSIEKAGKLVEPYLQLLCAELEETAKVADSLGLRLSTIYIGGGTPTTLTAQQLRQLTDTISRCYPVEKALEYTIEAGRPDTIDEEKLKVIGEAGATRISINPQTLNDQVLKNIGRKHTAQDILDCIMLARKLGFSNINCDLIAGLNGETPQSFRETVDRLTAVAPENITVHTLSVKRAARLRQEGEYLEAVHNPAAEMIEYAQQKLGEEGYIPYYLYRQRDTLGNLENTGYCKPGREGYYNVFIMEEVQTILAVGAGATTKLRHPHGEEIERIFNFKYPYEYINRFEQILERKKQVVKFYERVL